MLVGSIVSSSATTSLAEDNYCPAGCQRIHREAGEVCDIFILDFCEEGIKRLSQINTWSVKTYWWLMAAWQSADPKIQTALHRRQTALSFGTTFSQPQNPRIPTHER